VIEEEFISEVIARASPATAPPGQGLTAATLAAIRRASSLVSSLAADRPPVLPQNSVGERLPAFIQHDEAGRSLLDGSTAAGSGVGRAYFFLVGAMPRQHHRIGLKQLRYRFNAIAPTPQR